VAMRAKDRTLVLHIGIHKTATTFVQNVLSARRYDLLREGVLYPTAGTAEGIDTKTREGAQSGHILFTRFEPRRPRLVSELMTELPDTASTVLLSSEDFSLPRRKTTPAQYLNGFSEFGTVKVVLVLRRQDEWIESWYKQIVDQYGNFETRSFEEFLRLEGPTLLDFYRRFSPWRDLVGPENFHLLSYDDLPDGASICRSILEIAGVESPLLESAASIPVPQYQSVRAIDTLGLRILNSYRLPSREARVAAAKLIYSAAPTSDIELMTPEVQAGIEAFCAPINERIEAEWCKEPVPGLRFGFAPDKTAMPGPPSGPEVVDYIDRVISLCEEVREQGEEVREQGEGGDGESAA
jgi:hypothetical protein